MKPQFGLADIPDTWWIRLNSAFVDELDQLNRPYKYNGGKRGRAQYWEAGELHRRTLDKMTPEELIGYKRRHSFFEKLWGRHRWKDYHFAVGDPRRHVDTGPWITKEDIEVLREGINIDDVNVNKAITGFRLGKFSDNVREMLFKQLPIIADKWWAWMLGYYFGAGNIHNPTREGEYSRVGGLESIYIRMRVHDPMLPKFLEVARNLGMQAVHYQMAANKYRGAGRGRVGVGTSELIVFGWPEFVVLKKFGLPTAILDEKVDRMSYQLASANYRAKIPEWILEDDECMQYFIEGYLSTGKCPTVLDTVPQVGNRERNQPHQEVRINAVGYPDEDVREFIHNIHLWFSKHGVTSPYSRSIVSGKNRFNYTLTLVNMEAFRFLMSTFELNKPAMRARLYLRMEAEEDPVVYEALRKLKNPENVVLGAILEQPMTADEVSYDLRMYPEKADETLENLILEGLIIKKVEHYHYEPAKFIQQSIANYNEIAEEKRKRAEQYGLQLLYQCQQCTHVYITKHSECGLCGGKVTPTSRWSILTRLHKTRMYDMYLARKLEAEI